jgi:hypothetical protein
MFCIEDGKYLINLTRKKKGYHGGIVPFPNLDNPSPKRFFDTAFSCGCKGNIYSGQGVPLAQAREMSVLFGQAVMGPRVCSEVFRGIYGGAVDEAFPVSRLFGCPHLPASGFSEGAKVFR